MDPVTSDYFLDLLSRRLQSVPQPELGKYLLETYKLAGPVEMALSVLGHVKFRINGSRENHSGIVTRFSLDENGDLELTICENSGTSTFRFPLRDLIDLYCMSDRPERQFFFIEEGKLVYDPNRYKEVHDDAVVPVARESRNLDSAPQT